MRASGGIVGLLACVGAHGCPPGRAVLRCARRWVRVVRQDGEPVVPTRVAERNDRAVGHGVHHQRQAETIDWRHVCRWVVCRAKQLARVRLCRELSCRFGRGLRCRFRGRGVGRREWHRDRRRFRNGHVENEPRRQLRRELVLCVRGGLIACFALRHYATRVETHRDPLIVGAVHLHERLVTVELVRVRDVDGATQLRDRDLHVTHGAVGDASRRAQRRPACARARGDRESSIVGDVLIGGVHATRRTVRNR
mmetsp:Transcript_9121/g.37349  ORF Transcript_9121/g.37349 Transcript_9121/m.37349 type:complete len:252 (-) Transcript_9121:408-1163(-)